MTALHLHDPRHVGGGHSAGPGNDDLGMPSEGARLALGLGNLIMIGILWAASWLIVGLLVVAGLTLGWLPLAAIAVALLSGIGIRRYAPSRRRFPCKAAPEEGTRMVLAEAKVAPGERLFVAHPAARVRPIADPPQQPPPDSGRT
jgi:hypothetical protein